MFESKIPEMPYSKSEKTESKKTDLDPESHKIEHISKSETKPKVITDKNTDKKKKIEAKLKEILEQERRNFDEPPYQIKEQTTEQNHTYPVLETKKQNLDFDSLDKLFYKTFVPSSSEKTVFNDLSLLQKQEKQLRKINKKDKIVVVDNTESLLEWIKQTKIKGMDAVVAIGCRFADKGDEPSYLAKQVAETSAQLEKISKELVLSSGKEKIGTSITEAESLYEYIEQNLKWPQIIYFETQSKHTSIDQCFRLIEMCYQNNWDRITIVNIADKFYLKRFAKTFSFLCKKLLPDKEIDVFIVPAGIEKSLNNVASFSFDKLFSQKWSSDIDWKWMKKREGFNLWNIGSSVATDLLLHSGAWKKMCYTKDKQNIDK